MDSLSGSLTRYSDYRGLFARVFQAVSGDRFLQIGQLFAGQQTDVAQRRKMFLRARKIVQHEIRFTDVFMSAAVARIEHERLLVMLECRVELLQITMRVAEIVFDIGIVV